MDHQDHRRQVKLDRMVALIGEFSPAGVAYLDAGGDQGLAIRLLDAIEAPIQPPMSWREYGQDIWVVVENYPRRDNPDTLCWVVVSAFYDINLASDAVDLLPLQRDEACGASAFSLYQLHIKGDREVLPMSGDQVYLVVETIETRDGALEHWSIEEACTTWTGADQVAAGLISRAMLDGEELSFSIQPLTVQRALG